MYASWSATRLRRLRVVLALAVAVVIPVSVMALDYFGDIASNRLVVRLSSSDGRHLPLVGIELPLYLILDEGVPVMSATLALPEGSSSLRSGKLDIVALSTIEPGVRSPGDAYETGLEKSKELHLEFRSLMGGWSDDTYELTIRIPFTVDRGDSKLMLKLATQATIETRWRDPRSPSVSLVTYWSGLGGPVQVDCKVIESTLGFKSKPLGMGWPRQPGGAVESGRPTPLQRGESPAMALRRIQCEFLGLPRPLATGLGPPPGVGRPRAALTQEAGAFLRSHSRLELIAALFPFLAEETSGGDAALVLSALPVTASDRPQNRSGLRTSLQQSGYECPQRPGTWGRLVARTVKEGVRSMYGSRHSSLEQDPRRAVDSNTLEYRIRAILEHHDRFPARFAAVDEPPPTPVVHSLEELLTVGRPEPVSEQLEAFVENHPDALSLAALYPFVEPHAGRGRNWERSALILSLGLEEKYWPLMRKLGWPPGVAHADKVTFEAEFYAECTRMVLDALARASTSDACGGPRTSTSGRTREGAAARGVAKPTRDGGGGAVGGPYRCGGSGGIPEPKRVGGPEPTYPEAARRAGIEGKVILKLTVSREGRVTGVTVLRGLPLGLTEAAVQAVRQWTYEPARLGAEPVDVILVHAVEFDL